MTRRAGRGFGSDKQRKAMFAKLQKGDIINTPQINKIGVYSGKTRKGHKILTTAKGKPTIIITKLLPKRTERNK